MSSGAPTPPPLATQETGNYGVLTTSAIEFFFVVDPLDAAKVRLRQYVLCMYDSEACACAA